MPSKYRRIFIKEFLICSTIVFSLHCSGTHTQVKETNPITKIDIQYSLGNNHYRFLALADSNRVSAKNFLDGKILKETDIDSSKYSRLLEKTTDFVINLKQEPNGLGQCHSSYKIEIQTGKNSHTGHGCRNPSDGTHFSKIIREAEFLLYSKK